MSYVTPNATNAAATTANTDYVFTWGATGQTQVNHVLLNNNTGSDIRYDFDVATSNGSPVLPTGQTLFWDSSTQALHLLTSAQQNVNGTSSGNIVVRATL